MAKPGGLRAIVAAAALLSMTLLVAADPVDAHARVAAPVRVMVVGDSLTQGSAGDYTWRYRLWRHLTSSNIDVDFVGPRDDLWDNINQVQGSHAYAAPGFDTHHDAVWGGSILTALPSIAADVASYDPTVVLVLLGVNDLVYTTTPTQTLANMVELVSRIRSARPEVSIVLGTVPDETVTGVPEFNSLLASLPATLSTAQSPVRIAATHVDYRRADDTWDGAHPNARGELKIAAAFADALAQSGIAAPFPRPIPEVELGPTLVPRLTVVAGDRQAQLSWSGSDGATAHYILVRDATDQEPWTTLPWPVGGTSWTDHGLTNGHRYEFKLQPVKGAWAATTVRSNTVATIPRAPAPGRVSTITATGVRRGASVTWSPASQATHYVLWLRNGSAHGVWRRAAGTPTGSAQTLTGLIAGDTYQLRVQAINDGTPGPMSAIATVVPTEIAPAKPRGVRVTKIARKALRVEWRLVPRSTEYRVFVKHLGAARQWHQVQPDRVLRRPSIAISQLKPGGRYAVKVQALVMHVKGPTSQPIRTQTRPR